MKIAVKAPSVGESVSEVSVARWIRAEGDPVKAGDPLCEIESEKATLEVTADGGGTLHIVAPAGATVAVGAPLAEIDTEGAVADQKDALTTVEAPGRPATGKARTTPTAAKILEGAGIPDGAVTGSGPGGRITKEDARRAVERRSAALSVAPHPPTVQAPHASPPTPQSAAPLPASGTSRPGVRRERMTTLRQTISRRLLEAKQGTAMLTTVNEVDMLGIQETRAEKKAAFQERYGVKLGFMSFFASAVCSALREYPVVNAAIDGDSIVYHDFCDLSVAVSTPRGLVAPVVRDADSLGLPALEVAIQQLAQKARDGKLSVDEMRGGTFTLTNGGVFGSLISTPLINPPQSAILGMHTIQERPVARGGLVVVRPMMYVSLSYDHRIVDGRESVLFVMKVKELLESPEWLRARFVPIG